MQQFPYMEFDDRGAWLGVGMLYVVPPADNEPPTYPAGYVACTTDQYAAAGVWTTLVKGAIVIGTPPAPTLAEEAQAAMLAGLTITLSGDLTLDPTAFPIDPGAQAKLTSVILMINTEGTFPGGALSYPMRDMTGAWHTFTVDQYKAVAGAIAAYAAPLYLIIDGNPLGATELPSSSVSLTV